MTIEQFKDKLVEQCGLLEIECAHISAAAEAKCPCITWTELPPVYAYGDNEPFRQLKVQVDYFIDTEYDMTTFQIEDMLSAMDVTVGMPDIYADWDRDRQEYRTSWICTWMGG